MKTFIVLLVTVLSGLCLGQWSGRTSAHRINPAWFIEQPDPFEILERPDAYEAPEIPDALFLSAIRNDPGAHQAIDNYRIAHRAAYDAKVSRYQQQFSNPAQRHVGAAPIPSVAPAIVPVQASPVQTAPVQASPVQTAPVQAAPVQAVPVQAVPVQAAPVQAAPVPAAPVQAVPVQAAPMQPPVRSAPNTVTPAPVPTQRVSSHRAQVPLYNFIEQPDPFEMLERPDAYEAPEIPDALLLSAIRNDPGAHQAIDNYRRAHRAAYDAKVSRYQQQFMPQANLLVRTAPATVRQLPVPATVRQLPVQATVRHFSVPTPRRQLPTQIGQLPVAVRQLPVPTPKRQLPTQVGQLPVTVRQLLVPTPRRQLPTQVGQFPAPVKINSGPVKPATVLPQATGVN
ncbi:MAGE-like protein 2 [Watersipora subatra]|uniref:MAGE-like protein 2 n=1 Tax=Watersipora subatra TaxID=2589382 RepID=UPI00355B8005